MGGEKLACGMELWVWISECGALDVSGESQRA